jgi:transposase
MKETKETHTPCTPAYRIVQPHPSQATRDISGITSEPVSFVQEVALTPEQHRAELLEEKSELPAQLTNIKVDVAAAIAAKNHNKVAELAAEKADIVAMIADVDAELRQLKQELPHRATGLQDLHLVVQLVAAQIASSDGAANIDLAIIRLNQIKERLAAP